MSLFFCPSYTVNTSPEVTPLPFPLIDLPSWSQPHLLTITSCALVPIGLVLHKGPSLQVNLKGWLGGVEGMNGPHSDVTHPKWIVSTQSAVSSHSKSNHWEFPQLLWNKVVSFLLCAFILPNSFSVSLNWIG